MLKELSGEDWLELLGISRDRVPSVLILRGTRNLRSQYQRHRQFFSDVVDICSPNSIFEDVLIGRLDGYNVAYASVYGAPMASEITDVFGRMGTHYVIQTGCCGAIDPDASVGEVVLASKAFCGDGASQYYVGNISWVFASETLLEVSQLAIKKRGEGTFRTGSFYSTSALLAEGREDLLTWRALGADVVDMEMAATYAVASATGMEGVGFCYVFDNPWAGEHLASPESTKHQSRVLGDHSVVSLSLQIAVEMAHRAQG